jgi:acyl carrier protein
VIPGEIEIEGAMEYRALIASALVDIGVDGHRIQQIESGAMIYGDAGLLDSVHLVALIAAIEERLSVELEAPVSLFGERGVALVDDFKDVQTLVSLLEDRATGHAAAREPCWEIKR